ncbi:MAG: hypothetical protein ABIG96_06675 [Candidatus Micrarchaeota archaeon]
MKENDEMQWKRGMWWCRENKFGFGFWFGLFLLAWGMFELASQLGYIKGISFPFWPLLLIFFGISMMLKRI